jgi:hypothetical protein
MKLDEEMSKYLDIHEIKCTCGSNVTLHAEIVSKGTTNVVQYLVKCSNNLSPLNNVCLRNGMIWKNELIYNWE